MTRPYTEIYEKKKKTDISNLAGREFKVMILRIVTGLEKRVEDMNEAFITQIRNTLR